MVDKTSKLTLNCSFVRDNVDFMRVPIIHDDDSNLGASIDRYISKLAPDQERFYCKAKSEEARLHSYSPEGKRNVWYFAKMPLGKHTILELFKRGAAILGLAKPDDFYPHSLRSVFITELANDDGVNSVEVMNSARHACAESSAAYQCRSGTSESKKFAALGMVRPRKQSVTNLCDSDVLSKSDIMEASRHASSESFKVYDCNSKGM